MIYTENLPILGLQSKSYSIHRYLLVTEKQKFDWIQTGKNFQQNIHGFEIKPAKIHLVPHFEEIARNFARSRQRLTKTGRCIFLLNKEHM